MGLHGSEDGLLDLKRVNGIPDGKTEKMLEKAKTLVKQIS